MVILCLKCQLILFMFMKLLYKSNGSQSDCCSDYWNTSDRMWPAAVLLFRTTAALLSSARAILQKCI